MTLNTLANNAVGTIVVPGDWSIGGNTILRNCVSGS